MSAIFLSICCLSVFLCRLRDSLLGLTTLLFVILSLNQNFRVQSIACQRYSDICINFFHSLRMSTLLHVWSLATSPRVRFDAPTCLYLRPSYVYQQRCGSNPISRLSPSLTNLPIDDVPIGFLYPHFFILRTLFPRRLESATVLLQSHLPCNQPLSATEGRNPFPLPSSPLPLCTHIRTKQF